MTDDTRDELALLSERLAGGWIAPDVALPHRDGEYLGWLVNESQPAGNYCLIDWRAGAWGVGRGDTWIRLGEDRYGLGLHDRLLAWAELPPPPALRAGGEEVGR